ncbi:ABC transporter substrate-binding protein [Paenibacillus sp. MBLB4367]|uniref:ABC transporter substrate-binding protein n=1 Tax=Paenibacillus sp. MBLB4367 TaxID=3384767 RepID=UPI003907FB07
MKTSKTAICCLNLILLSGLAAACSNQDAEKSNGKIELSLLYAESLFGDNPDKWFKEFESKYPNIKLKVETLPPSSIFEALRTRISAGEVPDLYQLNIGHVTTGLADQQGLIYDLSTLEASKNYSDSIRKATSINGKQALFTLGIAMLGLPYDKAMFAEAGYNEPPKTWEQFIDAGKKLKAKGKELLVYSSKWETGIGNVFHWTFGTHALKDEAFKKAYLSNSVDWSKPEYREMLKEGFKRFKEMNDLVRVGSFTNEYAIAQQSFVNGDSAATLGGTWEAGTLRKLNPKLELGFMNMPYEQDDKNAYVFVPEDGIAINAKGKHIEEAKTFLNWLFSKETYAGIVDAKGSFSAQPGVGKLDDSYKDVPRWLETNRMVPFANTGPIPSSAWIALGNAAQEYTFKGNIDNAIDKFIAEYNKSKAK